MNPADSSLNASNAPQAMKEEELTAFKSVLDNSKDLKLNYYEESNIKNMMTFTPYKEFIQVKEDERNHFMKDRLESLNKVIKRLKLRYDILEYLHFKNIVEITEIENEWDEKDDIKKNRYTELDEKNHKIWYEMKGIKENILKQKKKTFLIEFFNEDDD